MEEGEGKSKRKSKIMKTKVGRGNNHKERVNTDEGMEQ